MKREVSRRTPLTPSKFDLDALERFERELLSVVGGDRATIKLGTGSNEAIECDGVSELRVESEQLPSIIKEFSISLGLRLDGAFNYVRIDEIFGRPFVFISSPTASAAAAVEDVCRRHTLSCRQWYAWIRLWHIAVLATSWPALSYIARLANPKYFTLQGFGAITWLIVQIILWMLVVRFDKVFPALTLVIRPQRNYLRKYSTEISLVIALLALIVSIIAMFT